MKYAIVIEKGESSISAYVPDLPGCVAVGESEHEVRTLILEAVDMHLESLRSSGEPLPAKKTEVDYIEIDEAA